MNIKTMAAAFGVALTTFAINANAQKTINEGVASFSTEMQGHPAEAKIYFKADSDATVLSFGAGYVKFLSTAKHDYFAVILNIPVMQLKKAGISTPAEIEQALANAPAFTFKPTTETKTISGFSCKKVVATSKDGKAYDIWITNDVTVPSTAIPYYYQSIGGYPVQYTEFMPGPSGIEEKQITISSLTDAKAPAGTFGIPADVEKVGMADLHP